jgi:hypothetical protein
MMAAAEQCYEVLAILLFEDEVGNNRPMLHDCMRGLICVGRGKRINLHSLTVGETQKHDENRQQATIARRKRPSSS